MRLNGGVEETRNEKKKVGDALKITTIEYCESSEEVHKDKEMTKFARRFKKFMRSNRGRNFQKKEGLKLESTKEKDHIIYYECRNLKHINFGCLQWKKKGSSKQNFKAHATTSSYEDSSNNEDQEVTNLCLIAINDPKVTYKTSNSISYSCNKLQDAYDELGLEFETMVSKYKEKYF
ncbi:hypothetical protein J1N35_011186 [Gossypium stocksii]|uniref:Uncharacterized protein n=1 Tax=Gossypium stocksii TaxID=47602 RepID=A0A9D3W3S6_9ROSI|nr:hypothetical protein J1N35_011186 [Gossypium stocksii]